MSKVKDYGDALERTLWTAAEGAGAVGLVAGYQALPLADIPPGWVVLVTVVVGALLAAGKGIIATNVGNGTASLGLPATSEPVPAAVVRRLEAAVAAAEPGPVTEVVPLDDAPRAPGRELVGDGVGDFSETDRDGDGRNDATGRFQSRNR